MNDLPLVLVGSLLGSAHCVGMCGGFAMTLGLHSQTWRDNLLRQLIYSAGRLATYSLLGLGIGLGSRWLQHQGTNLLPWQAIFATVAGLLLIYSGIRSLGWGFPRLSLPRWSRTVPSKVQDFRLPLLEQKPTPCAEKKCERGTCSPVKLFQGLLVAPQKSSLLVAGAVTGFLPCGLVYAFLTLAASRANPVEAWLTMVVFGVGTIPLMVFAGLSTALVPVVWRATIWKAAAACLIVCGILSLWRGTTAWQAVAQESSPAATTDQPPTPPKFCPLCK